MFHTLLTTNEDMKTNIISTETYETPTTDVRFLCEAVRICADSLSNNEPFVPKPGGIFDL